MTSFAKPRSCCVLLAIALPAIQGCGDSPASGEPLVSGSVTGSYAGAAFTMQYGVVAPRNASFLIVLGSEPLGCGIVTATDPPTGDSAAISVAVLDVGSYTSVDVNLFHNITAFTGVGSNAGAVVITSSSPATIAGTIAYADTIETKVYALAGTFEVVRCP